MGMAGFGLETRQQDFLSQVEMLTTLELYDQPGAGSEGDGRVPILTRDVLGRWDRSDQLAPGRALLIAQADGYLPAKVRFDTGQSALAGPTVVRVVLDVDGGGR